MQPIAAGQRGSSLDGLVVLAVDDEQPALDELAALLGADDRVGTVLVASDAVEALRILNGQPSAAESPQVDAVFVDIRMPGLDGFELALGVSSTPAKLAVVFVTAQDDRAADAYALGAVDYLLKPLCPTRLATALDRIVAWRTGGPGAPGARNPMPDRTEVVPVELAGTTTLVPRSTVRYAESHGDYARLHTGDRSHLIRVPLTELEHRWRDAGFVRVHRRYLVESSQITELTRAAGSSFRLRIGSGADSVVLPVSRRRARELRQRLVGGWRHGRPATT